MKTMRHDWYRIQLLTQPFDSEKNLKNSLTVSNLFLVITWLIHSVNGNYFQEQCYHAAPTRPPYKARGKTKINCLIVPDFISSAMHALDCSTDCHEKNEYFNLLTYPVVNVCRLSLFLLPWSKIFSRSSVLYSMIMYNNGGEIMTRGDI